MSMRSRVISTSLHRPILLTVLLLPLAVAAQNVPASSGSAASMDMGSMPGMTMPAASSGTRAPMAKPAVKKTSKKHVVAKPVASHGGMHDMHHDGMPEMDHRTMSGLPPAQTPPVQGNTSDGMQGTGRTAVQHDAHAGMSGMTMGPMQGGSAPPHARSPDYSDGVGYGPMKGMDMLDNAPLAMLLINQLEALHSRGANGQRWEAQGWYGNDENKLWVRTEGTRSRGKLDDGDVEVLWSHSVAAYWNTQLGVRHDFGSGPSRDWAAFGVQGLAPYWFEVEATGYVGVSGRTAARLRADYEWLFTQRLILQPEFEVNLYGRNDPAHRIGRGISDTQLGLRLRYEIHRQLAPYIGVVWTQRYGATADYARQDRQPVVDRQFVAGVRFWF
ncbi:MAG TPA: copper resistance protein B [Rhodanobacter sp.]|nr:copper resistance protein B [Rhodanobacter sp.]